MAFDQIKKDFELGCRVPAILWYCGKRWMVLCVCGPDTPCCCPLKQLLGLSHLLAQECVIQSFEPKEEEQYRSSIVGVGLGDLYQGHEQYKQVVLRAEMLWNSSCLSAPTLVPTRLGAAQPSRADSTVMAASAANPPENTCMVPGQQVSDAACSSQQQGSVCPAGSAGPYRPT